MATMWRKAMLYLGLGPDEEYEDYDPAYDDPPPTSPPSRSRSSQAQSHSSPVEEGAAVGAVRPMTSGSSRAEPGSGASAHVVPRSRSGIVRPLTVTPNAKLHVVVPTSFNQAQEVADKFKGNQPVIVNLQAAERDLARRLIDFNSGLCYGLGGQMEKVANQVYLLTPSNVEVSAEERRRLHERGYDT